MRIPSSYPLPPWKLRSVRFGPIMLWEVAPDMFVGANDFVTATNAFIDGSVQPTTYDKLIEMYGVPDKVEPAPLRDLRGNFYEVLHGWLVWAGDRAEAERDFEAHGGLRAVGNWGHQLVDTWQSSPVVGLAELKSYGDEPSEMPLNRWKSRMTHQTVWEVAPDRFIYGDSEADARQRFADNGMSDTFPAGSPLHKKLDLVPDSMGKPQADESKPLRQFKDKDNDTWFLLEDHMKLYCTTDEDEARDHPEDADEIKNAFNWGPFQEIDSDNNVIAAYDTAEELMSELQTSSPSDPDQTDPDYTDTDEKPKENPTMTSALKPPTFVAHLTDSGERHWYEVGPDRWGIGEGPDDQARAAYVWRRYIGRGGPGGNYGRSKDSLQGDFSPLQDKGFVELKIVDALAQDELLGSAISHDHCSCPRLDDQEKEQEKWFKVGSNTFCVDCGKLRP